MRLNAISRTQRRAIAAGRRGQVRRHGRWRVALACLAVGLLSAACISSVPPPPVVEPVVIPPVPTAGATEVVPIDDATITLVEDYWAARDAAWSAGVDAGLAFTVANNHPLLDYTSEECRDAFFDGTPPVGFAERNAVKVDSIERDPDFRMVVGPLAGQDLGPGILRMIVAFRYEGVNLFVADRIAEVHLQIREGERVTHFLVCEPVEIQVAQSTSAGGDTTVGTGTGATPTGGATTGGGAVVGDPVTVLPPITATPVPVPTDGTGTGSGGTGGDGSSPVTRPPPGSRPTGSGVDFCEAGSPGAQPAAGDYFLCPDDDIDPTATAPPATANPSEDVTRG